MSTSSRSVRRSVALAAAGLLLAACGPAGAGIPSSAATSTDSATGTVPSSPATGPSSGNSVPPPGSPPHVMVIVEENHSLGQLVGNSAMPFLNSLISQYALATNYSGVSHPSEPNYLAMVSGSIWDNPQDRTPAHKTYPGPTVVDQLAAHHVGWRAYLEDMPTPCDLSDNYGPAGYDVNHNPFLYFTTIRNNPAQCANDVPFTHFAGDLNSQNPPSFIFVAPNTTHDMHDGTLQQGDQWLSEQFRTIFASNWYQAGGIVVVTFDEGETTDQVVTLVVSQHNRGAPRFTAHVNHYGLLRGIESTYGLPLLGAAADPSNGDLTPLLK